MSKDCNKVINVSTERKNQIYKVESFFAENGKYIQELMEESLTQNLKSKLSANPVGYLPAV